MDRDHGEHLQNDGEHPHDGEHLQKFRARASTRGVNPLVYVFARAVLLPFFLLYFRLERIGAEHIPRSGPLLLAANHRSFLDPFVIGALTRRPVYYVAKRELFARRSQAWLLNALGAFPIDRGAGDTDAMATARAILQRGDCVVIFPEGTRVRSGGLGSPRRGIGRLALETGARVVPVAVAGTEDVRRGWRIRPRKVRLRCGAPLGFPLVAAPSPALAATVTERVWARIGLQWEWLRCGSPVPASARHRVPSRAPRRVSQARTERDGDARAITDAHRRSEPLAEREARAA
jgi:glycerol-3-phosphate dehydrogenase (NAD(P)+)